VARLLRRAGVPWGSPPVEVLAGADPRRELALVLGRRPEALVLDDPTPGLPPGARRAILEELAADAAARGTAVFVTARDAAGLEGLATHVGILREGRLVADEKPESLSRRFRRIRYRNEITEERTAYGTELDAFDAVRVKVRGWGIEAVVSNFGEETFAAFASLDGVVGACAEALSLGEIFAAVAGEEAPSRAAARDRGTATP
jgi:ABC-type multidrug transport system ATPase subunit